MSDRKELFNVSFHTDDDTGMYEIGELDFGLTSNLRDYVKRYGKEELLTFIEKSLVPNIISFVK